MKLKILILLLGGLGLLAPKATSQSTAPTVLATAGGAVANGQIQIAWTLGEPIIQTAGRVTQGFHSTDMEVISSTAAPVGGWLVQAFPNPVNHALTLEFKDTKARASVKAVVWNTLAQQMLSMRIPAAATCYDLDCTVLPPGIYSLELRQEDGAVLSVIQFLKQ